MKKIERAYITKFLGVQIDAQLNWKNILNILVKSFRNVLINYLKQEKCYANHVLSAYIVHLHIQISYIIGRCGTVRKGPI